MAIRRYYEKLSPVLISSLSSFLTMDHHGQVTYSVSGVNDGLQFSYVASNSLIDGQRTEAFLIFAKSFFFSFLNSYSENVFI
jgi:hypothetical protein